MFSQSSHVYVDVSHAEKRAPGHGCISTAWPVGAAHTEGDLAQEGSVNLRPVRWFTQEAETEVMTHVTEEWRRTDTQALKMHKTLQTQRCYRHTDTNDTREATDIQMRQTHRRSRHRVAPDTRRLQTLQTHIGYRHREAPFTERLQTLQTHRRSRPPVNRAKQQSKEDSSTWEVVDKKGQLWSVVCVAPFYPS